MSDTELQAQIDAAETYEALFVTALFAQWAPLVLNAANVAQGQRVLDVACGTGVLAREAALQVGSDGHVSGLDINPGMLAVAGRLGPGIEWREGGAESMPYPDESFDAVVSQFGLMFYADRRQALLEMLRVLRPNGSFAVAVWDAVERIPAYLIEVEIVERIAGEQAAGPLRAPFVLGSQDELAHLFATAGLEVVDLKTHPGTARFPSIRTMIEADLEGWLPLWGIRLTEEQSRDILAEAESALSRYVASGGTVEFPIQAIIASGTRTR